MKQLIFLAILKPLHSVAHGFFAILSIARPDKRVKADEVASTHWGIGLFLTVVPAILTFVAGQLAPALSGILIGLVGIPFLITSVNVPMSKGDTKGILTIMAVVFGLLTLGCVVGTVASLAFDNWKV